MIELIIGYLMMQKIQRTVVVIILELRSSQRVLALHKKRCLDGELMS